MKRLFPVSIFLGSLSDISEPGFDAKKETEVNVHPTMLRWFCGMHDMESTYICRML